MLTQGKGYQCCQGNWVTCRCQAVGTRQTDAVCSWPMRLHPEACLSGRWLWADAVFP